MYHQANSEAPVEVDVLICGAGPVGLLVAYILARMNVKTFVVGRFCTPNEGPTIL